MEKNGICPLLLHQAAVMQHSTQRDTISSVLACQIQHLCLPHHLWLVLGCEVVTQFQKQALIDCTALSPFEPQREHICVYTQGNRLP